MTTQLFSLTSDLARLTSLQPDKIALLDGHGRTLTYRALSDQIIRAQAWLDSIGVRPGDSILALMPNAIETIVLFLASLRGGFTYAPLPCTSTIAEINRWKNLAQTRFCLLANPVSLSTKEKLMEMDWLVKSIDIGAKMPFSTSNAVPAMNGGRLVMASSGSTGEPKAIVLDADRLWSAANAFLHYHGMTNADVRFWNYLPMSYLGGLFNLTLIPLAAGGSIFVDADFNGKTFMVFWSTVDRFKINSLWLVPTIMRGLLALADRVGQSMAHPKIDYCFLGTAPVSLSEKQRFAQIFGIQPLENYGLSETTFISSERLHELALRQQSSMGAIMPHVDVKLMPVNKEGAFVDEIWVRTPYIMLGYLDSHGKIDPLLDDQGYFCTGDLGKIVDGQLQLSGRQRDIIKKGGILIPLREIELIAESNPQIAEAAAVRTEHAFYGESFDLYVRTHDDALNQEQFMPELTSWLHGQLIRHKWPERIIHCADFPRTASGKVQKHLLNTGSLVHAE